MSGSLELFDHTQPGWQTRLPQQQHAARPRPGRDFDKRAAQLSRQRFLLKRNQGILGGW